MGVMTNPSARLAPPGSGIPLYQRLAAKFVVVPLWRARLPWEGVAPRMRAQADELDAIAAEARRRGPGATRTRVLIPPTRGLEDDSRYWSLAMVADHLARVNRAAAGVIAALTGPGEAPRPPETRIVDYKPDPASDDAAFAAVRASIDAVARALAEGEPRRGSRATHAHPWFGPLDVRTWAVFPAMHQALHLAQARRIASRL